jgi:iron complex outermembrane receptor protein
MGDTMNNFKLTFFALPLSIFLSTSVLAQVALEEIVVTAQKTESSLQDTPIAVTAVTEATIKDLNIKNVVDMQGIAPNVMLLPAPANNTGASLAIRGGVAMNPAITWEPSVGTYLDGVYVGKTQGAIWDLVDLERVEILRGPQGTLYGRNTLAGAVNFISKKPSGEGMSGGLTLGNYGLKEGRFIADYRLGGNIFTKVVIHRKTRDGFVKNVPGPYGPFDGVVPNNLNPATAELDLIDSKGFKLNIYYAGDQTTVDFAIDWTDQDNTPPHPQLGNIMAGWSTAFGVGASPLTGGLLLWPAEKHPRTGLDKITSLDKDMLETSVVEGTALTITHETGIGELKLILAKRKLDWDDQLDMDGTPYPIFHTERHTTYSSKTVELQLTGSNDFMSYVAGYYQFDDDAYTFNPQRIFGGGVAIDQHYSGGGDASAFYAQATFDVGDRTDITIGTRRTEEDKKGYASYSGYWSVDQERSDSNTSNTFIVAHQLTDTTNIYAKLADGFKAGGYNTESSNPAQAGAGYGPEIIESVEFGLKGMYMDNRLSINAAFFDNEHEDMQIAYFTAEAAAASVVLNNSAEQSGFELEAVALLNDTTQFSLNYGSLDSNYTESVIAVDGFSPDHFPYAPEYMIYASLEKDFGNYRIRLDHSRISEHNIFPYSTLDPRSALTHVDERAITDFRLMTSPMENLDLTFWIKNLNNEEYVVNMIPFGPGFGQLTLDFYGHPRTIGMDLYYKF